ncbi:PH domain-containing protein [Staphylococcus pasteuri]|uniref:Membrane protein YdbS, contains bPH2 (Pleckstrin homology) domain n=5 Tax=Staphylococcus TaxID=1279 RepID=A0ABY1H4Q8_9STAP|nr:MULTISPECIES: PH domain-containing protein [Staphylococcus]RQX26373.1 PH domain-containing protein [Staphylococcus warneri]ATH62183.1 hypothetical protein BJG87_03830 [Staphylococcus pasteuri]KKI56520.1 hypothetical protein UF70_1488 [Staphylococcus pasteuri]MBL3399512.1 PH domain-containing protein [Staphylococcus pasteuri]MBM6507813.1 PH domain-containing protein [Staphylococcus pasteuri]
MNSTFHKSPKNALTYYFLTAGLSFIIEIIIYAILFYLWYQFNWWHFIIYIYIVLWIVSLIRLISSPLLKYNYLFYRIQNNVIEVKSTFFFKHQDISKIERLQFLQINTNPLARKFKINEITFVSAGHSFELPFVSEEEAEFIQEQIFSQLRGAEYDV